MQERLGELIPRLKQMEAILKEYQQRFGNVHESGDYTESSWLLPAGKELLLKIKLKKSLS
jgi:hypothetical protein